MSSWWKGNYPAARSNGDSSRRNSTTTEEQKQTRRTNTFYGPLESHWHFPEPEKKKPPLTSKLTFKSLQKSLTKVSKSNAFRTMFQGVHDPNEEKVVKSLRDTLLSKGQLPEKYDDYHTLLRFLRLRNFNMSKAEIMFVNMLKWRDSSGVDLIAKEFKFEEYDAVKKCYPHGYHGVDKYGRPLYIERIGLVDLNAFFNITTFDRYVKYHIYEQEKTMNLRYPACSLAVKRHIASTTAILDVKGLGTNNFSRPAREIFTEIQRIDSNYYPETLNQLYIINAGPGFKVLWKILSAFFDVRTLAKIQILGTKYQDKLSEAVDLSNLPDFLGGNCKCYEHGGCLMKDTGPWTHIDIITKLMDVFNNAEQLADNVEQLADEPSGTEDLEVLSSFQNVIPFGQGSSNRRLRSSSIRTLSSKMDDAPENYLENTSGKQYTKNKHLKQKINELEEWLVDTDEILQLLNSKQQELADHIEQLKKLNDLV
ncbi:hypothetical protein ZIOFF_045743 [Zingiber officinale]|uniref:CRAL-TRIO domain-containing protein n=1 Tax=Zingiber officinale TaxID=94328 RepID=A0A8J5GDF2_ZINOF|nr:hypothetical protein ZIOFF_045743 [Zingiber officinale]